MCYKVTGGAGRVTHHEGYLHGNSGPLPMLHQIHWYECCTMALCDHNKLGLHTYTCTLNYAVGIHLHRWPNFDMDIMT